MKTSFVALLLGISVAVGGVGAASAAAEGPTLSAVKKRGHVQCGVGDGLAGFSLPDKSGKWAGFDVDFCRALAAAIFGKADAVEFTPTSDQNRFAVLQAGEVDLLSRNTTVTLTRDTALGFNFAPTNFYDGDAFMVPKSLGVKSAKDLKGATVCVRQGTSSERNLVNYSQAHGLNIKPLVIGNLSELATTFFAGRCDAWTSDSSQLAAVRTTNAPKPDDYVILPEVYSKSPLAIVVRHGDDQWLDISKWLVYATFQLEESGITSANVDEVKKSSTDPDVQKLLGVKPGVGADLGLSDDWVYNIAKNVGNYGEIFERNLGQKTPFKMNRGLNGLWNQSGLLYADPF